MTTNTDKSKIELKSQVKALASSLLMLRKAQDISEAEFINKFDDVNIQELNVLNTIGDSKTCIMSDIAKNLSLSLSSVTIIVDKLVRAGLVERIRGEDDRRIVFGRLTLDGYKIYQAQIDHLNAVLEKILLKLTVDERGNLIQVIQKVAKNWI